MKYKYVFNGMKLHHEPTIRKWLQQTFGNEMITKSCTKGTYGVRSVFGAWQIERHWTLATKHPAFHPKFAPLEVKRLQIRFKKEEHLSLFLLKFGHLS